jgi:hypothetical protein
MAIVGMHDAALVCCGSAPHAANRHIAEIFRIAERCLLGHCVPWCCTLLREQILRREFGRRKSLAPMRIRGALAIGTVRRTAKISSPKVVRAVALEGLSTGSCQKRIVGLTSCPTAVAVGSRKIGSRKSCDCVFRELQPPTRYCPQDYRPADFRVTTSRSGSSEPDVEDDGGRRGRRFATRAASMAPFAAVAGDLRQPPSTLPTKSF